MRILLAGGGHTHLIAAPLLARRLRGRASIAMLAPSVRLLYSGMMPGWVADHYRFDDCVIDLERVCAASGIEWIRDALVDVDFPGRRAIGAEGREHRYDLLSLNVGSENRADLGDADPRIRVLGAKPFADFVAGWDSWRDEACRDRRPRRCVVVGGGAAAVELSFALDARIRLEPGLAGSRVTMLSGGDRLLPGRSRVAAALAERSLAARGIRVHLGVLFEGIRGGRMVLSPNPQVDSRADLVILANGARPPGWLARSARRDGIPAAEDGGISVDATMGSVGGDAVFASGDCASFAGGPVDRSGVLALRQGRPLAANLAARAVGERATERFVPPVTTLALLSRADGTAIGDWGPAGFAGKWVWRWKDRIDRRFIGRFR
jgi:NADH dehydrogenase FAD-containing subunit